MVSSVTTQPCGVHAVGKVMVSVHFLDEALVWDYF